jgi:beta-N-acetylhexosaminidase
MLTLEEKIGQMLMVGFHGLEAPPYLLEWLAQGRIGGVILFGRNVDNPAQVAALTQAFHQAAKYPLLISIDQEGGTVARLRAGFTESPGAMALGAAGSEALAEEVSAMLAAEMRALGINWTLAPVVDIAHDIRNPSVGARSLGTDIGKVSGLVAAEVRGFQRAGVPATAKHFPGHGKTPVDPHLALPVIDESRDYLWEHDLVPFRAAVEAGVAAVMISHVKFEQLDAEYPATLSPVITRDLLRRDVGFSGLTCTDCMEMKAIANHYTPGESAVLAALAGADLILFSHSFTDTDPLSQDVFDKLLDAANSGRLPLARIDEAVGRVMALKERVKITTPPQLDLIRRPDHLALAQKAARAGTALLRADPGVFPLVEGRNGRVALVEFASIIDSEIMERGGLSGLAQGLATQAPFIECVSLTPGSYTDEAVARARQLAREAEVFILATRNAHLIPQQLSLATELLGLARQNILLCLRNPYDAEALPQAGTVICICGDSTPSLAAAIDALLGRFTPNGILPVPVNVVG